MSIQRMMPECNPITLKDGRGGIFTFYPTQPVVEWNIIYTRSGTTRGFHYHTEFEEYVLVTQGHGVYVELRDGREVLFKVGTGDCLRMPIETAHTLYAISDMVCVALLTRRWDDCEKPITRIDEAGDTAP